ncbi:MAG: TolC family protein, partial [Isosphaeraceae bacterium]|nr:TolC family protein [Isosphaeraceae bacterium]
IDPISLSRRAKLEIPPFPDDPGPPDGLTLDAAIELLIQQNLDLMALRFEIPKAQADILTASLRNNPIIYGDTQYIPYGHYSFARPGGGGGQPQYDVNVTFPIDISRKRRARIEVAERAKKVSEAQLQDAVRDLINELYTAYVNVLAVRDTLRYSEAFLAGMTRLLEQARVEQRQKRARAEQEQDPDQKQRAEEEARAADEAVDSLDDQVQQARLQVRQAGRNLARTTRQLALLLNIPAERAESLRLRGRLRELQPLPAPSEELVRAALENRPDLAAYRLAVGRAQAEVRLAKANRYSDIYVIYQPYTLQGGRAYGLKGTYSYALGVNAALPLFNRNQGNIARAEWNVRQTRVELASLERRVVHEVREEIRDFQLSQADILELETKVLPASRLARDDAYEQYRKDATKVNEYIDKQDSYNQIIQQYRNALIEHRQSALQLNTAIGVRVLP